MKTILLCCVLACGALFMPGCVSAPERTPEAIVFDTLKTTYNTARAAYTAFNSRVVDGKVPVEQMQKVDEKWNSFRQQFMLALRLAANDWNAATPIDVQNLSIELINFINSL